MKGNKFQMAKKFDLGNAETHLTVPECIPKMTATSVALSREIVAGAGNRCSMICLSTSSVGGILVRAGIFNLRGTAQRQKRK